MHHHFAVTVLHATKYLLKDVPSLLLTETALLYQQVEKLAALHQGNDKPSSDQGQRTLDLHATGFDKMLEIFEHTTIILPLTQYVQRKWTE